MSRSAALWLLLAPLQLLAQDDPRALLHDVVSTLKNAHSLHLESVTESELTGERHRSWTINREVLAQQGPERVRYETDHTSGPTVVVSDGVTLWRAAPAVREFMRTTLNGPLFDTKGGGQIAIFSLRRLRMTLQAPERMEEQLLRVEQLRRDTVDLAGRPVPCIVLRAEYAPPPGSVGIESVTRTFWVDPRQKLVLREEIVSRGRLFPDRPFEQAESKHTKRYLVASVNEPVSASLFVYTPPPAFREVDQLVPAFPRAATDLVGKVAPALSLPSLTGETIQLTDFRGKVVLLDFWATWCHPCRQQMPALAKLYEESKDKGVVLLGVNDDESPEKAVTFLQENGYHWPSLYDGKQKAAHTSYKIAAIPTLVLIDREGTIVEYQLGSGTSTESAIRTALQKLGVKLH